MPRLAPTTIPSRLPAPLGVGQKPDPVDRSGFGDRLTTRRAMGPHMAQAGKQLLNHECRPTWRPVEATSLAHRRISQAQWVDDDFSIKTPTVIYRILRGRALDDMKSGGGRRSNRRAPVRHLRSPSDATCAQSPTAGLRHPSLPSYSRTNYAVTTNKKD